MEHGQARTDLVGEREQVELGAQLAVVALLGLDQPLEVGGQVLLRGPGRAVDPLQHRVLLVAAPVGAGHPHQLEVPEPTGVGHVGPTAQIDEARRVGVGAHQPGLGGRHGIVGLALDDLDLERVVAEQLEGLGLGDLVAHEGLALGDDGTHAGVETFEIVGGEGLAPGQREVVVEAVGDGRPDGEGGARELVEHRLGQDVGGRVAQRVQAAVALLDDDGHVVAVVPAPNPDRARCR